MVVPIPDQLVLLNLMISKRPASPSYKRKTYFKTLRGLVGTRSSGELL